MAIELIVTDAGRAALVNADNTGTSPVTVSQVGLSSTAITANQTMTALAGEFARVSTIGGGTAADDTIHLSMRDEVARAYSLRSFALYLSDGSLFALYGQAAPILTKTTDATALIALDIKFADVSAASLIFGDTAFTDPAATTTVQGIVELATTAETLAATDPARVITPAALGAALMSMILTRDGAGSGIDADMLDGQHGSYYGNVLARLGYTPVNRAGDTMLGPLGFTADPTGPSHAARKFYVDALTTAAAILAKLLTVDGSGSGIDADMVDGQHGAWYSDIPARLGYTPINKAGDSMNGPLGFATDPTGPSHAARKAYVDALTTAAATLAKLVTVDGSGSGIDADMLDGKHAAAFALANTFSTGSNANGRWWKRPDGNGDAVIVQQGTKGGQSDQAAVNISFPIPMLATDYDLQLTVIIPGIGDYDNFVQEVAGSRTVNGVQVYVQDPSSGGSGSISGFRWRIEGY